MRMSCSKFEAYMHSWVLFPLALPPSLSALQKVFHEIDCDVHHRPRVGMHFSGFSIWLMQSTEIMFV